MGEKGAGKSTLMKILYGVTQPDSGHIWFVDQQLSGKSPRRLSGCQMPFRG
ncbi:ATP-binding cassette domain-containing protein [Endozoicomonas sp. YOMI1]|uniref:ATP-binding cassette domain-containing protein n=1 Tax=Endozoicomonas sp. YOMI1 TaxID=2828739 RepID=UPI0027D2DB46|nr:ATP-binding cassette domain-containing protein [Endozoicomonas sp. YOMI1]